MLRSTTLKFETLRERLGGDLPNLVWPLSFSVSDTRSQPSRCDSNDGRDCSQRFTHRENDPQKEKLIRQLFSSDRCTKLLLVADRIRNSVLRSSSEQSGSSMNAHQECASEKRGSAVFPASTSGDLRKAAGCSRRFTCRIRHVLVTASEQDGAGRCWGQRGSLQRTTRHITWQPSRGMIL